MLLFPDMPAPPPPVAAIVADYEIDPTTGLSDQGVVDTGAATLWSTDPMLIAGHQNMGWDWLDELKPGDILHVADGPAEGYYVATGHRELWYSHSWQGWMFDQDLITQTCIGDNGLGFTTYERISS